MQIRCNLLLILAVILPVSTQIPPQPIPTADSPCLNNCLKQGSLIFAASNLRNFWKIVLHFEEFCNIRKDLLKCTQSCSDKERQELTKKIALSEYICKDKLEEFRLVKECMENHVDIDSINKCSNECGYPLDATLQLDSSPASAVNPSTFTDGIAQVCGTIECTIKCTVTESNKICAGSGYLFRDIAFKQVLEASDQLYSDAFNSSSGDSQQQLAKTYLETLPQQCAYLINPINYNMTFVEHETNDESRSGTSEIEKNTMSPSRISTEETLEIFNKNSDDVITRIFDTHLITEATEVSKDGSSTEPRSSHKTMGRDEEEGWSVISISTLHDGEDDEERKTTVASHEQEKEKEEEGKETDMFKKEETTMIDEEREKSDVIAHLQHLSTSTTAQDMTEHTIIVNDDKDNEIDNNIIAQRVAIEQKNATKQGTRERITLLLLLMLPLISLYLPNQWKMHMI